MKKHSSVNGVEGDCPDFLVVDDGGNFSVPAQRIKGGAMRGVSCYLRLQMTVCLYGLGSNL